jgi:hypothetical protein
MLVLGALDHPSADTDVSNLAERRSRDPKSTMNGL